MDSYKTGSCRGVRGNMEELSTFGGRPLVRRSSRPCFCEQLGREKMHCPALREIEGEGGREEEGVKLVDSEGEEERLHIRRVACFCKEEIRRGKRWRQKQDAKSAKQ